jgi:hypothetical protein
MANGLPSGTTSGDRHQHAVDDQCGDEERPAGAREQGAPGRVVAHDLRELGDRVHRLRHRSPPGRPKAIGALLEEVRPRQRLAWGGTS